MTLGRWADYKRCVTLLQGFLERIKFTLTALVVSTFPEDVKRTGWPSVYASVAAHAFAGWVEALSFAGLFGVGFLRYVNGFMEGPGWLYLRNKPGSLGYGDFFGMGALGYVSYLVTPVAWVTLYCFAEGIVRALEAAYSQRMPGMALVALPWRAMRAVRKTTRRRRLEEMLGPDRPDEVVMGKPGSPAALTIYAAREKPWSDYQVLEYAGDFYESIGVRLVGRGFHHVYRYEFRRLDPGDIIRGVLVCYEPGGCPAPAGRAREQTPGGAGNAGRLCHTYRQARRCGLCKGGITWSNVSFRRRRR